MLYTVIKRHNACYPSFHTFYLKAGSVRELLLSVSFLSVKVELASEPVACGPAVHSISMPVVFVERALIELHKGADRVNIYLT